MAEQFSLTKILLLKRRFWQRLGVYSRLLIYSDMKKGILQNLRTDCPPKEYSDQYKKYKKNYMNKFGRGKNKTGKGQKIKAYAGQSVVSNRTNKPNMRLTGDLINGLRVIRTWAQGVMLAYAEKDKEKIKGNELLCRYVRGLREKNQAAAQKRLEDEYEKNLKIWGRKPYIIEVK